MNDDLLYLLQRYAVTISATSENRGTGSDLRYYSATVVMKNDATQVRATGFAHGAAGDDTLRQDAIQSALSRLVRIAKAIEDAY